MKTSTELKERRRTLKQVIKWLDTQNKGIVRFMVDERINEITDTLDN